MECFPRHFSSVFSFLYQDESKHQELLSIFKKIVEVFDKSFDMANKNDLPPYQDMQRFFMTSYMANLNKQNFDFKLFFKMFKECWICLIAIYEFLSQKSFFCFVNFIYIKNILLILSKTNVDWRNMNPFMCESDMLKLRLNLFKHRKVSKEEKHWDWKQDELLKFLIK